MPSLSTIATTTTTEEIRLSPTLRRKLLMKLKTYAELHTQKKAIEAAMDRHKAEIGALREDTGHQSIEIEGYKVTQVAGVRKKFDAKRFVANGGDLAIYNNSMIDVPNRPYEKVTLPGEKDRGED
jgi:hypothetical protein